MLPWGVGGEALGTTGVLGIVSIVNYFHVCMPNGMEGNLGNGC